MGRYDLGALKRHGITVYRNPITSRWHWRMRAHGNHENICRGSQFGGFKSRESCEENLRICMDQFRQAWGDPGIQQKGEE